MGVRIRSGTISGSGSVTDRPLLLNCIFQNPLSRGESFCDHFTAFFKLSWSPDRVRTAQLSLLSLPGLLVCV